MKTIIYDFGSYNGNDIDYYLLKSDLVVAVEANPFLAEEIRNRFTDAINSSSLIVVNKALASTSGDPLKFYVHKEWLTNSTLVTPPQHQLENYDLIEVESIRPSELIRYYGNPYYIKIDIEGIDHVILRDIFSSGIKPKYISAESHHINTFCALVHAGYDKFKLIDGPSIPERFSDVLINTISGDQIRYSFQFHTAGPFGDDIPGDWLTANVFFKLLAEEGLGWKDVHAYMSDSV